MENDKLYLCMKTTGGDLVPFYEINGSFFSTKKDKGGSVFNMDVLISNINTTRFEEKTKKLKNDEKLDLEQPNLNEEHVSLDVDQLVEETEIEQGGTELEGGNNIKFKEGERTLPTCDLEDSILKYIQKKDY